MSNTGKNGSESVIDIRTVVHSVDPSSINPNEVQYEFGKRQFRERPAPKDERYDEVAR